MVHRKLTADNIFTGYEMLAADMVLVVNNEGAVIDLINEAEAGENIERHKGILSPGFINCHCHLELSHMRGIIPEKSGMVDFLLSVMNKRKHSTEKITGAISAADSEMSSNGIVAVGDICNTDQTIEQKKESGIYYQSFIEATGFADATALSRFSTAVDLYNKFAEIGAAAIVPHAPYSVSNSLFTLINDFKVGGLLTMHNQESIAENEFFVHAKGDMLKLYAAIKLDIKHFKGTGKSSMISSLSHISPQHKLILVHNVLTNETDLQWVRPRMNNLYWCLCPNANKYIGNDLPDINLLKKYTSNIVLGTDSLASNHELNILSEVKTIKDNYPALDLSELLKWATINGAEALGIDDKYGSFDKGKKPGVNLISASFKITPLLKPVAS